KVEGEHARYRVTAGAEHGEHLAVATERAQQRLEIAPRQGWRALAVHVVRVGPEEVAGAVVDPARQPVSDSLANHCPLFARYRGQVGLGVRQDGLAERHIEILTRPIGFAHHAIAKLEMLDAQVFPKASSRGMQRADRLVFVGGPASIGAEWERRQ